MYPRDLPEFAQQVHQASAENHEVGDVADHSRGVLPALRPQRHQSDVDRELLLDDRPRCRPT
jgi:hypothetical protein